MQITLDRYSHVMPRMTSALADGMDHAYRDAAPDETSGKERNSSSSTSADRSPR